VGLNTIIWTVTDGAGNSDTCVQNIEVEVAIGMESGSRNHQIRVLPNPVGNLAVIDLHDIQFIEIELYDAAGNKAGVFYDTKIDLSAFSKGLYYVKVITAGDVFVTPLVKD
jgi:extracellular elastinolytic metalloproteinase